MVENFIFPLTRAQFDELVRKIDGVSNQRLNYNQFMFKIKKGGLSRETPVLGRVTPASDTLDNVVSKLQQKVNRIVFSRFGLGYFLLFLFLGFEIINNVVTYLC